MGMSLSLSLHKGSHLQHYFGQVCHKQVPMCSREVKWGGLVVVSNSGVAAKVEYKVYDEDRMTTKSSS